VGTDIALAVRRYNGKGEAVTGIKQAGEKKLMLFSGRAYPDLAYEAARELRTEIASTELREFANGEIYVREVFLEGSVTSLSEGES
jgi:hypothetical protein